MKTQEMNELGIPKGAPILEAIELLRSSKNHAQHFAAVVADPQSYLNDEVFGALAAAIIEAPEDAFIPREEPAPWKQWGEGLDANAIQQMKNACDLPVSVAGALMPDAHLGYGLPIGGVLATEGCVIPYAVGVDIACRMKMTVLDLPTTWLNEKRDRLKSQLSRDTQFGIGATFKKKHEHDVMDQDWEVSPITKQFKDKAWAQLGTSGSGNHFVEFGVLTLTKSHLGLEPGQYLALLSHSGSRGTGANVASHYSKLAHAEHADLPRELMHLSWLDLDSEAGNEYWNAMNLMGDYAAANHACIHRSIAKNLGVEVLADIENHHNFAWKEEHLGKELIVHRKGATPAGEGVLGIIPGSMASPAFVVRGKGNPDSLNSASHGAGRVMSRTAAKKEFHWPTEKKKLEEAGITLLSAGLDEVPGVYKDIHTVMAAQDDLVETLAQFDPKIVKMAPAGERPED
ncbi:MAG: RtcB family protein [Verrucomicrobiales bacterium]|nr:RtcB family protein [Verrucomicrobiales bacterium]